MMYNYPFFNFPSFRHYSYRPTEDYVSAYSHNPNRVQAKKSTKANYNRKISKKNPINSNTNINNNTSNTLLKDIIKDEVKEDRQELFDFMGIKLYFDDVLLICLIFFLYNEGVKDQYLFISLIMLLLS